MDIAALSMSMAQSRVLSEVNVSVLANTLDIAKESSGDLAKMMEQSVNPNIGGNIDLSI